MILIGSTGASTPVLAEPQVSIIMEKTTYTYCERLVYSIEVSEITGELAYIFIRDDSGVTSEGIPIIIEKLSTQIPSPHAFEKEIFPAGKYFIDLQYLGIQTTAEFNLINSDKIGKRTFVSEFLLPGNIDIIFLSLLIKEDKSILDLILFSKSG